ncbi:hypothetical protein SCH4B_3428 [Ruegeria sp. TrichCH4B]|nr:hypothetical protein SCH4B_3428 [Ruegeria sp. TrichCH4B]
MSFAPSVRLAHAAPAGAALGPTKMRAPWGARLLAGASPTFDPGSQRSNVAKTGA